MSTLLEGYITDIKIFYPKGTTMYKTLFPKERNPFTSGTQLDRILSLDVLIKTIGSDVNLQNVKAEIQTYYDTLNNSLSSKDQTKKISNSMSTVEDNARIDMCVAMYSNYAKLIDQNAKSPVDAIMYFDEASIRNTTQHHYTGTKLHPLAFVNITKHTFAPDDVIVFFNNGKVRVRYYITDDKDKGIGSKYIEVLPMSQSENKAAELGDVEKLHFLNVYNVSDVLDASWEVLI
jgi:hypothetical protein